jgi:GTPase SAR1 family protein
VLLLGQGAVGKTSLVKRLTTNTFDPNEAKTEGIDIHRWQVNVDKEEIYLNIWDFGGQEIMHATHQFFLTKRSLYLLAGC